MSVWMPGIETVPELLANYYKLPNIFDWIDTIEICQVYHRYRGLTGFHWAILFVKDDITVKDTKLLKSPKCAWLLDSCSGFRKEGLIHYMEPEELEARYNFDLRVVQRIPCAQSGSTQHTQLSLTLIISSLAECSIREELSRSVISAEDVYSLEYSTRNWCICLITNLPELHCLCGDIVELTNAMMMNRAVMDMGGAYTRGV